MLKFYRSRVAIFSAALLFSQRIPAHQATYDVLIRNGHIVDGTVVSVSECESR